MFKPVLWIRLDPELFSEILNYLFRIRNRQKYRDNQNITFFALIVQKIRWMFFLKVTPDGRFFFMIDDTGT